MVARLGFHVVLPTFGWGFYAWSLSMLLAISLLLAAQRADDRGATSTPSQPGHSR